MTDVSHQATSQQFTRESIIADYRLAYRSRQASLIGRREVLTGKAKFGIFGDGKEVAQLAMARAFRPGDFRSGYYRDQTFMFATGMVSLEEFFAQLYADPDVSHDPSSAGRSMNCHFGSRTLNPDGTWRSIAEMPNSSSDMSPTASQMPRLVGLGLASRLYRELPELAQLTSFSRNGDEIAFGTIGNASCAEGMFWESVDAIGVLQAPVLLSIWDDGYGISVPNEFQHTGDLSDLLSGFQRKSGEKRGYDIYRVRGWDYPALCETYLNAASIVRMEHVPAIIHVVDVTQPQGHSTSGSHERYKSKERLDWETEYCCNVQMRLWMIAQGIATAAELDSFEEQDLEAVRKAQRDAWDAVRAPMEDEKRALIAIARDIAAGSVSRVEIEQVVATLDRTSVALRRDMVRAASDLLLLSRGESNPSIAALASWRRSAIETNLERYGSDLYCDDELSALNVPAVPPVYSDASQTMDGFRILNHCFDKALERYPNLVAFGEDVGKLGDVNQGFAGMQEKYGALRVSDTGIRECTIVGQAIGLALRGIRPIADIQYLDYILYGLQLVSDDLATLRWRTKGGQMAPVILRTRGHRLEGTWHSGSPMAGVLNLIRGLYLCVPRNMVQAAGFYNTLLRSNDPAVVIEVLNGYRVKEKLPDNIGDFTLPLGVPEILREGSDVTLVTYGATTKIVMESAEMLARVGIDAEVIDVQTLLPFDIHGRIAESLRKTSRVVFVDEDVPGGGTAYMLQEVLERQKGYELLDSQPRTVAAKAHRAAYGSDGDYFSKPNREEIFEAVYGLMNEVDPRKHPIFY
ncbi:MAG: transketolase C-terminal domain-containing protein [Thermoanaerobaculia bacterium]|jgi:pyruvate/2-oxoglutarate/acetoin dehydrogenase E1 component/TPP-dependent pyruvate/acetoin dehydrogenase alpha subunit